jgi:hypothetical protein
LTLSGLLLLNILARETTESSLRSQPTEESQEVFRCVKETIATINPAMIEFEFYRSVWELCGNQRYNALVLTDFRIRREKIVRQSYDARINLWMVVVITVSGVVLAGMQLAMSYKLATVKRADLAKDSTFMIEQGKISFRSSVTGLSILAISLAFFAVYVTLVFPMEEFRMDRPANLRLFPSRGPEVGTIDAIVAPSPPPVQPPGSDPAAINNPSTGARAPVAIGTPQTNDK